MKHSIPRGIDIEKETCVNSTNVIINPISLGKFDFEKDHGISIYNPQTKTLYFSHNCMYEETKQHLIEALPSDKSQHALVNYYGKESLPLINFLEPFMEEGKMNATLCHFIASSVNENGYVRVPSQGRGK